MKLGKIVTTKAVQDWIDTDGTLAVLIGARLNAHECGKWGEVTIENKKANDLALQRNEPVFSAWDY